MKFLVCTDSFKGSLSSPDMCAALSRGILSRLADAEVREMPLADGGEGTAEAISAALCGRAVAVDTVDPFGEPITASFAAIGDRSLAVIDTAASSGLAFAKVRADFGRGGIMRASTYGTGLMIRRALEAGYKNITVGLGGSATNDCGIGAAAALGMRFFGADGGELDARRGAAALGEIAAVSDEALAPELRGASLTLLYDVDIPLLGERGCARNYAPQKGASPDEADALDRAAASFALAASRSLGRDLSASPGAGAAGGLGFGLALCGGELRSGAPFVLDVCGFDAAAGEADVVVTGEGKCDAQTVSGKLPAWVARRAKAAGGAAVVCVCGADRSVPEFYALGADAVLALADGPMSADESVANCAALAEKLGANIAGLCAAMRR